MCDSVGSVLNVWVRVYERLFTSINKPLVDMAESRFESEGWAASFEKGARKE